MPMVWSSRARGGSSRVQTADVEQVPVLPAHAGVSRAAATQVPGASGIGQRAAGWGDLAEQWVELDRQKHRLGLRLLGVRCRAMQPAAYGAH